MNQQVLRQPFDIETHKKTFINYLEVVILEDGTIVYAVPSHQKKLIEIACRKLRITEQELNDLCPKEYYFDFMTWLCMITKSVSLWNDFMHGKANEKQREAIQELIEADLYHGTVLY
jgi:hypothetical protein